MGAAAGTRRALARALLSCEDAARARAIARAARSLADGRTARLLERRFHRLVRSRPSAAAPAARAVAVLASISRDPLVRALALRMAGTLDHLAGHPRRAARKLLRAGALLEGSGRWLEAGDVQRVLMDVLMHSGEDGTAIAAARRAQACYARADGADPRRLGSLAAHLGNLHHRRDRHREALRCYAEARAHLERAGDAVLVATVDYNRANVLVQLDRLDEARAHYERSRAVFRSARVAALDTQAAYALAGVDLLEGLLDRCVRSLEAVRARAAALGDRLGVAHAQLDEAEAYLRLNRPDEAERAARAAYRWFRRAGYDTEQATCLGLLGGIALQRVEPGRAIPRFRRARDLERRTGNPVAAAIHEIGLAQASLRAGRPGAALQAARHAAKILGRRRLRSRQARALSVAAEACLAAGRLERAREVASAAVAIARRQPDLRARLSALLALGRAEEALGRRDRAFRHLLEAERCVEGLRRGITSEESRLAFSMDKSEVYEALVLNRLGVGTRSAVRQALAFSERGKARALAERLAQGRAGPLGQPTRATRGLLLRLEALERALATAESRLESADPRSGLRGPAAARLGRLTAQRLRTLRDLWKEDPGRAALNGAAPLDPLEAIALLGDDEVVLEYAEAGGWFHAFVIGREGIEAHPRVARVEEVRDAADLLRFQLGKGSLGEGHLVRFGRLLEDALRAHLERLHDLMLGRVASRLERRSVRIVPHGLLHGLPFHAFESGGSALVDRAVVSYAPSLAVIGLLRRRRAKIAERPLVLGVPDASAPAIEAEVEAVRRSIRDARVLRGPAATTDALRRGTGRPELVHVACHGFYGDSAPWSAGLRLGDAWLSLPEVYALPGTGDLVVLSGCETGRGAVYSGDEWVGLVRGFLQAGARAVVASLWEVHDRSAARLMGDFYAHLAGGHAVAEALALAQRRARRDNPMPLGWAPFMVIGEPGLRLRARKAA